MSDASVRFTEVMTGYVDFGERDHEAGATAGRERENRVTLGLTVTIDDLARFAADARREAGIVGWVDWEALGGRLAVEQGAFHLLVGAAGTDRKLMRYRLFFRDGVGHPVTLVGEKRVGPPGLRVWSDTTTLYVRALRGRVAAGTDDGAELVALGIVRLRPRDFARQLTTFRATGRSRFGRLGTIARFDALFGRRLWGAYGPPIVRRLRAVLPVPVAGGSWFATPRRSPAPRATGSADPGGPR